VKAKKSESQLCFHKSPAKDGERWEVVGGGWQVVVLSGRLNQNKGQVKKAPPR